MRKLPVAGVHALDMGIFFLMEERSSVRKHPKSATFLHYGPWVLSHVA